MIEDNRNLHAEKTYSKDAYEFVNKSIKLACNKLEQARHLSAYEVLVTCRELAEKEYSFLANNVLQSWGIYRASDIGNIVYQMVNKGILSVSPEDNIDDFDIDFEFFKVNNNNHVIAKKVHDPIIID